jgi:hypothetical protein
VTTCPFTTLANKFNATFKAFQSWSQKKICHANSELSLAREVVHLLEIAQDARALSNQDKWLLKNLKKHSLGLSSLQRTIARSFALAWIGLLKGMPTQPCFTHMPGTANARILFANSPLMMGVLGKMAFGSVMPRLARWLTSGHG